jgi:hypothetical protein
MSAQTSGFGAARRPPDTPCVPPRKISDQITPVNGVASAPKPERK